MQAITGAPEGMTRAEAARLAGLLPAKIGFHAVQQDRILKDGKLNACWLICDKSLQTAPNTNNETDVRSSKVKRTWAFTPVHDPPWPHAALPPPPLALG